MFDTQKFIKSGYVLEKTMKLATMRKRKFHNVLGER